MKCYNHHDRDAFAICQYCGKGLCLECLDTKNDSILCKNSKTCAIKSDLVNQAYNQLSNNKNIFLAIGILFVIFGIIGLIMSLPLIANIPGVVGITFVIIGIIYIKNAYSMKNKV